MIWPLFYPLTQYPHKISTIFILGSIKMEPVYEKYHVFINHRGPDTKKSLAVLIHRELNRYALNVFLDMEELRTGDAICPAIRRAIASSSVHIAIFSRSYAESRPCLNELCWILSSSHERTIIPVFCDVEPCHLRDTSRGPYAAAFQKHQAKGKVTTEVVERWKGALKEAAEISGLVFQTNDRWIHIKFLLYFAHKRELLYLELWVAVTFFMLETYCSQ